MNYHIPKGTRIARHAESIEGQWEYIETNRPVTYTIADLANIREFRALVGTVYSPNDDRYYFKLPASARPFTIISVQRNLVDMTPP